MAIKTYYRGSDMLIEMDEFTDIATDLIVTDATLTARILNKRTGTPIATGITMPHVANGLYRGVALNTVSVTKGQELIIEVTATKGGTIRIFEMDAFVA